MAFWIGFALPFGPVLGLARTALVLAESSRLSWVRQDIGDRSLTT